jgi:hypothetical protein
MLPQLLENTKGRNNHEGLFLVGTHIGCLFKMMWITAVLPHRILSCLELRLD